MWRFPIGLLAFACAALGLSAGAQDCGALAGRWPDEPYGMVRSSALGAGYAYYGNGLRLTVLDIADPAAPALVREIPLPGSVDEGELLLAEGFLLVPLTNGSLKVFSLTAPDDPTEVASLGGFAGLRGGMELFGGMLYAADQTSGLRVISLSPPTAPVILGSLATSHARDVAIYETTFTRYAYVADAYDGLVVMDVTNPTGPSRITAVDLEDWPECVARSGEYLYVVDSSVGLRVFSLSDPALPVEVGTFPTSDYTEWVSISGSTAYLCNGREGLLVLDLSAPATPTFLGSFDTGGIAMHVTTAGDTALVSDDFAGLRILDISSPAALVESAFLDDSEESSFSLWTDGSLACVTRYAEGLALMDVSDPAAISQVGLWPKAGGSLRSVTLSGNTAFVSERWGDLHLVDVTTPSSPVLLGSYADHFGFHTAVSGSLAYFAADAQGVLVLDVSDPADPHQVFRFDTPGSARFVALDSGRAYVADASGGLRILDLSTPAAPTALGALTFPGGAVAVAVSGPYAFVAASGAGLKVVDVSDPASPQEVGSLDTPGNAIGVEISGSVAFVADYGGGVHLVDVSSPDAPALIGTVDTPGNAWQTRLLGETLFVADDFGFVLEDVSSCCSGPPGIPTLANPPPWLPGPTWTCTLDWTDVPQALRYDLRLDTANPPAATVASGLRGSSHTVTLVPGQTYFWQVVAHNGCGDTASPVVSFQAGPLHAGDRVWRDDDGDGVQDVSEPGLPGVVVKLYGSSYQMLQEVLTDGAGAFSFSGLSYGPSYLIKFFPPSPDYVFSPCGAGGDDGADSDADATTGQTPFFQILDGLDATRWDCGMVPGALCIPPDEPVYIASVTLTTDGNDFPVLNFMNPNQPSQTTGFNVYRTHDPARPHGEWLQVASDVVDMDEATPNKQWVDTSGDDPPPGYTVWYFEVAAFNHHCGTGGEGPW